MRHEGWAWCCFPIHCDFVGLLSFLSSSISASGIELFSSLGARLFNPFQGLLQITKEVFASFHETDAYGLEAESSRPER